jgi:hypothetical protein
MLVMPFAVRVRRSVAVAIGARAHRRPRVVSGPPTNFQSFGLLPLAVLRRRQSPPRWGAAGHLFTTFALAGGSSWSRIIRRRGIHPRSEEIAVVERMAAQHKPIAVIAGEIGRSEGSVRGFIHGRGLGFTRTQRAGHCQRLTIFLIEDRYRQLEVAAAQIGIRVPTLARVLLERVLRDQLVYSLLGA